jgi:hypothetical protein
MSNVPLTEWPDIYPMGSDIPVKPWDSFDLPDDNIAEITLKAPFFFDSPFDSIERAANGERLKQAAPPTPPPRPRPAPDAKSDPKIGKCALGLALLYTHHTNGSKPTVQSLADEMRVPRDALYRNHEFSKVREIANKLFGLFQKKDVK